MSQIHVYALQMTSGPDLEANFTTVERLLSGMAVAPRSFVVLPECFSYFGGKEQTNLQLMASLEESVIAKRLSAIAKTHQIWLVGGTIPIQFSKHDTRFSATSLLFDPEGECKAHYEKIHLFDVQVDDGTGSYRESETTSPGQRIVTASIYDEWCLGMSVCYDVRFPGLYQSLRKQGANILSVPSAFTHVTGKAHWETLIRARAIETQSFVIAANQTGKHSNGRETYGHSLIVSPWGEILAQADERPQVIEAKLDFDIVQNVRQKMPILAHNQFSAIQNNL
ncbi:carbon-nitrogen hydrolase family protein [Algicola sagamiensis]|uniref:carbon-nitrogen hydrolase family protein n=1 Tax=Algicola sagamiensis TaxID=163869 RepID=UPI000377BFDA|nr:carbon-nitrogen hydrolase family protein [Algicola sagamiensis]